MTICIACSFTWNYAPFGKTPDFGPAALVASDRMITAGDGQFEPSKVKVAQATPTTLIMVAGEFGYHSKAIKDVFKQIKPTHTPEQIATFYSQAIQAIKRKEAEDIYLAPLGLNTDTFIAQQRDMSESFVSTLREQLQNHRGEETEAIVIGPEVIREHPVMRIFIVDTHGVVTCNDDIGFAAIGSGAWHARSRLMQYGFVNTLNFSQALAATYDAKKASEVAPGVGKETDIMLVFKDHTEHLRDAIAAKLPELYTQYATEHAALALKTIADLQKFMTELSANDQRPAGRPGEGPQTDGGTSAPAAEAPRGDEGGPTQGSADQEEVGSKPG